MNRFFSKKILASFWAINIYVAVLIFVLTRIGLAHPGLVESIYSSGLYPFISRFLSLVSNVFPFSLDDVFYASLFIFMLLGIVLVFIRTIKWLVFLKRIVLLLVIVYSSFNVFWGFNYYREDLTTRLQLPTAKANVDELLEAFRWLVEQTNNSYVPVYSLDKVEVYKAIKVQYIHQSEFLKIDTLLLKTNPKSITLSSLFAAATISGYYGPFFSEVHINKYILPLDYPHVLAHEMAHKLGVSSEAEANFYAWLVCSKSEDKRLAYSANLYLMQYFVYECYKYEGFKEIVKNIRYEVRHDFYKSHYHWMALMNRNVELVATTVNDAYLKSNNVEEGIEDYEGVVKYVMDYLQSEYIGR
ncbi:DUF3810 domain-containing protein [Carboxylicivirga marina]|uniref:DUF3810 domain-containing protein n=1 Tax=Carboxylicivirga marina TaxID=2800988 RepID=A0ABS1HHS4_9BACT|nr:DUF3810 domain-containing protein [Carboxylicivirga marina]MBK3517221.1 DUF3810 domain-containing protein [Carboxylicivirga marina]